MSSFSNDFSGIALSSIKILAAILVTVVVIALVWYLQNTTKKTSGASRSQKKEGSKITEEKSLSNLWKSTPEWLKRIFFFFLLLFVVYLLFFMGQMKKPVYKQVVETEIILNKGEEIVIRVARGDSIHLSTPLPHLTVWQGSSEYVGTSKHYSGDDYIVIYERSRIVKITPCHGYYGTLTYTKYER